MNIPPYYAALAGSSETNNNPISWANFFSQSVGKAGRLGAHPQIGVADAPTLQQFPYHAAQSGRRTVIETPRNNAELFSPTNLPWASTSGPSEKPGCITG